MSRDGRRLTLVGLALCAACHRSVGIDPPEPRAGMESVLLIFEEATTKHVWVGDLGRAASSYPAVFPFSGVADAYALFYTCTLKSLGLSPGWQLGSNDPAGIAVPPASETLHTHVMSEGASRWAEDTAYQPPPDLRLPTSARCATFTNKSYDLPGPEQSSGPVAVAVDPHTALVGLNIADTTSGYFATLRDDESGARLLTGISTQTPHFAGYRGPDGRIWLLGERGHIAVGDPTNGFAPLGTTATATGGPGLAAIDGSSDASSSFELFTVSHNGAFDRYDGTIGKWSALDRGGHRARDAPGVVWVAPQEAFAIGVRPGKVVRYKDGALSEESFDLPPFVALSITYAEQLGVVVGTDRGVVFVRQASGAWQNLPNKVGDQIHALVPFAGGFLSGSENGAVTQYHVLLGWCESISAIASDPLRFVPFASGFLLTQLNDGERLTPENMAIYIVPDQAQQSCAIPHGAAAQSLTRARD
jgi:hypothetical protein